MYVYASAYGYLHGITGGTWPKGIYLYCASNKAQLYLFDSSGTMLAQESGASLNAGALYKIDMQIVNYGASSTVNVYVNGTLVITYSGSTAISGVSNLNQVTFGNNTMSFYFSEIIVADEDTRTLLLVTMAPNGAGTTDQWTGAYTNVNPVTINDANADFTNTPGQDQQYNLNDLPTGTFAIKAVKIAVRAMHTGGSAATGVQLGVNSGGTVNVGPTQSLTTGFATYERLMATNPVTGSAWALSDMNPLQSDVRSA